MAGDIKETFISLVKDFKLQSNVRTQIADSIKKYEGKYIVLTIEKRKSKRSDLQNAYYFGCVVEEQRACFKERWGEIHSKTAVHDWNKANIFCTEHIDESTGEVFKIPGSSAAKNKTEFNERMEMIRQYFWDKFEWQIPLPEQQLTIK